VKFERDRKKDEDPKMRILALTSRVSQDARECGFWPFLILNNAILSQRSADELASVS